MKVHFRAHIVTPHHFFKRYSKLPYFSHRHPLQSLFSKLIASPSLSAVNIEPNTMIYTKYDKASEVITNVGGSGWELVDTITHTIYSNYTLEKLLRKATYVGMKSEPGLLVLFEFEVYGFRE